MPYTWSDLDALAHAWAETFGESLPMGFEVGPEQVPVMRECLRLRSQRPLEDYVRSLDPRDDY